MAFYLVPQLGTIPYHKLENYALKRLQFLQRLQCCRNGKEVEETIQDASMVELSDCLISGTKKDSISHFILRLALSDTHDTRTFLCSAELALFRLQLSRMNMEEWVDLFKRTFADVQYLLKVDPLIQGPLFNLQCVLEILRGQFHTWHALADEICKRSQQAVCLPFQLVLGMVARRDIILTKGVASVPVCESGEVLAELFEQWMLMSTKSVRVQWMETVRQDSRMRRLAAVIKRSFRLESSASAYLSHDTQSLQLSNLWSQAELFPPCMSNLMIALKQRHRLRHHDRIQLTLFLKDLGLSLHDALLLWKQEYSQPAQAPTDTSHRGWHGRERSYIYNIRHLYGLEGARINYRSHSCATIQGRSLSYSECGGCPFVSSVQQQLLPDVPLCDGSRAEEILDIVRSGHPSQACSVYLKMMIERKRLFSNPVKDGNSQDVVRSETFSTAGSSAGCSQSLHKAVSAESVCPSPLSLTSSFQVNDSSPLEPRFKSLAESQNRKRVADDAEATSIKVGGLRRRRLFKYNSQKAIKLEGHGCDVLHEGKVEVSSSAGLSHEGRTQITCTVKGSTSECIARLPKDIMRPIDFYKAYTTKDQT